MLKKISCFLLMFFLTICFAYADNICEYKNSEVLNLCYDSSIIAQFSPRSLLNGSGVNSSKIINTAKKYTSGSKSFTFDELPMSVDDLKPCKTPFEAVAMAACAFARYTENRDDGLEMLNYLRGPRPLSNSEISFIDEHLKGQEYLPWSFFKGATPANNYTPSKPYKITVKENPYSYQNAGYATLYVHSGGADSDRAITVRKKESTGEWFLWTHAGFLASIRIPDSEDPWK